MSYELSNSPAESLSAAEISEKFKDDMQAAYENVENSVDFKFYKKDFYQYLQNLSSKVETDKSAEKILKFPGHKNDNAYVKKCFQQMAEDIRKLEVNEYLATVENSLLLLKLRTHDIERKSEGLSLDALQRIHKEKEEEWKSVIKTYTKSLETTSARFYFLQSCVIDNYEMCSEQAKELIPSVESSEDARMQFNYFEREKNFLADATKFLMSLRTPCMELSEKVHQRVTRPAEESHEHLFITPHKERPTITIIREFASRCTAVKRKWGNLQFRGDKCKQYLNTAYCFLNSVSAKTDHFVKMSTNLERIYCNVAKDANERIFIKLALDKKGKSIEEMKAAEQLMIHTNQALDTLVDTDNIFQPSTSSSSAE